MSREKSNENLVNTHVGEAPSVDELLDNIDLTFPGYEPSDDALHFWSVMQMIKGADFFHLGVPLVHYYFIDLAFGNVKRNQFPYGEELNSRIRIRRNKLAILCSRGMAKSSVFTAFLVVYMAMFGRLPGLNRANTGDKVWFVIGVGDSQENGAKVMCNTIRDMIEESDLLQSYFEKIRCTDAEIELVRAGDPSNPTSKNDRSFLFRTKGAQALPLNTKLHTDTGSTTISDCKVGDKIYGADGKLTTIIDKSEVFNKDVYELVLRDGRRLKVCKDHINSIVYRKNHTNFIPMDVTTTELLGMKMFYQRGTPRMYICNTDPVEYTSKEFIVDPYLLGLYLGDGTIRKDAMSARICALPEDWEVYKKYITNGLGIVDTKVGNKAIAYTVKGLGEAIYNLDLVVNALDKYIPEEYFTGSVEQRLALVQGLLDTDGSVREGGKGITFTSISRSLINGLTRLVRGLGGVVVEITPRPAGKTIVCGSECNCNTLYKINIKLNMPLFRLPRKLHKQPVFKNIDKVAIMEITKVDTEPTQCIAVDNADKQFIVNDEYIRTHNSGVRGQRYRGERVDVFLFDDLISTEADARSKVIQKSIRGTVYSDAISALRFTGGMQILIGTPFNKEDIIYSAIEKGWTPLVVPVCEKIYEGMPKEDWVGAWPEAHTYESVMDTYLGMKESEAEREFQQERMLRIASNEDKMIKPDYIQWYSRVSFMKNLADYNLYITTDFTASNDTSKGDYSVVMLWAISSADEWFMVDMSAKRMAIEEQYDPLFRMVQTYGVMTGRNITVGVETNGQQQIHIPALRNKMRELNIHFTFARQVGKKWGSIGISRAGMNKFEHFEMVVPQFQAHKIFFPEEMKEHPDMKLLLEELNYVTYEGFTARHDDCCDGISLLKIIDYKVPNVGGSRDNQKKVYNELVEDPMFSELVYDDIPASAGY